MLNSEAVDVEMGRNLVNHTHNELRVNGKSHQEYEQRHQVFWEESVGFV